MNEHSNIIVPRGVVGGHFRIMMIQGNGGDVQEVRDG